MVGKQESFTRHRLLLSLRVRAGKVHHVLPHSPSCHSMCRTDSRGQRCDPRSGVRMTMKYMVGREEWVGRQRRKRIWERVDVAVADNYGRSSVSGPRIGSCISLTASAVHRTWAPAVTAAKRRQYSRLLDPLPYHPCSGFYYVKHTSAHI